MTNTGSDDSGWAYVLQVAAHLALPVLALVMLQAGSLTRYFRASMLDVVKMDFIRTARAKGLRERTVILKHALRNALLPIITLLGFELPGLFPARSSPKRCLTGRARAYSYRLAGRPRLSGTDGVYPVSGGADHCWQPDCRCAVRVGRPAYSREVIMFCSLFNESPPAQGGNSGAGAGHPSPWRQAWRRCAATGWPCSACCCWR
jgi:hypothetical protein